MPGKRTRAGRKKRIANRKGRRLGAIVSRPRVPPRRAARVARRRSAVRRLSVRKPVRRTIRRAAAKRAMHRAALARIRLAAAAGAVVRAGTGVGKALRDTRDEAAREAVAAIKAADTAIEAALPHSGDKTEEE